MLTTKQLEQARRLRRAHFSLSSLAHMYGLTIKEIKKELTK